MDGPPKPTEGSPTVTGTAPVAGSGADDQSPAVLCQGLHKGFSRRRRSTVSALEDLSLAVYGGEFVVLLGPSGCGKTTLLRSIAGLEVPDTGSISMRGRRSSRAKSASMSRLSGVGWE